MLISYTAYRYVYPVQVISYQLAGANLGLCICFHVD